MDKYTQSEIEEAARVRRWLDGHDISNSPLWCAPDVPTFYNALMCLSPAFDIVPIKEEVKLTVKPNGMPAYIATVTAKRGNLTRIGAAISSDKEIAPCLAFRNAVRQLMPLETELVWQDTREKARRYI